MVSKVIPPSAESSLAASLGPGTLAEHYLAVRRQTEALCTPLTAEDCLVQSMPYASPAKWHLAHTTWFFETFLLAPHAAHYRIFDADFRFLFNSYYNTVGDRPLRAMRGALSRPSLEQVRAYRRHVDDAMSRVAEKASADLRAVIVLGLNHEQQHQELIVTDVKHALWSNTLRPGYKSEMAPARNALAPPLGWRQYGGGIVEIGHNGDGFCFDNELARHEYLLRPYELSSRLVTNTEYLEFIAAG